jgi:hypothetical protein
MSELNAIRNAVRAERELIKAENAVKMPPISTVVEKKPANVVKTAVGREVDISKGYNVRSPDGVKIPFRVDTPLDKAKEWTKNFHNPGKVAIKDGRIGIEGDEGSFIDFQQQTDGTRRITMSKTTKKGTGTGAGLYKALFDDAAKNGQKVVSDTAMSQASVEVWLRFKQMGYPVIEHPRKKMMSGGFENASSPNRPLFEMDTTKGMPYNKQPKVELEDLDRTVRQAMRGKQLGYDKRNEITNAWAEYKLEEDPKRKQQLADQLMLLLPKSESK